MSIHVRVAVKNNILTFLLNIPLYRYICFKNRHGQESQIMFQDLKIVRARMALARKDDNAGFKNVLPVVGALGNQTEWLFFKSTTSNKLPLFSTSHRLSV